MIHLECQNCRNADKDCVRDDTDVSKFWLCIDKQPIVDEVDNSDTAELEKTVDKPKEHVQKLPAASAKKEALMRANFQRLSAKRLKNVLNSIRVLGHLTNKAAYIWTPEEVAKVLSPIAFAINNLQKKFER